MKNEKKKKLIWPDRVIYLDEEAYRYASTPNHAFYSLSNKYMNKKIVLDKHDREKYNKQLEEQGFKH